MKIPQFAFIEQTSAKMKMLIKMGKRKIHQKSKEMCQISRQKTANMLFN